MSTRDEISHGGQGLVRLHFKCGYVGDRCPSAVQGLSHVSGSLPGPVPGVQGFGSGRGRV